MINKRYCSDTNYSIVELGGARCVFIAAATCHGDTLPEQAEDVLSDIKLLCQKEGLLGSVVAQTVFLSDIEDMPACREIMRKFYGKHLPATTYAHQPPCDGKLLSIEAWGLAGGDDVEIDRIAENIVVARHDGITWTHIADVHPAVAAKTLYDGALSAFQSAGELLGRAGFRFDEVVRTWLYLGDITALEGRTQRYLELNRARTDFYRDMKFGGGLVPDDWRKPVFPASTGVGVRGNDLTMGCIAMRTDRPDVVLLPLENPQQTSAFDYAHQYGTESPKFARAMAVAAGDFLATFISGTASITVSETRFEQDAQRQTHQTINNLEALISAENFRDHGFPHLGMSLGDIAVARVYVKRQEDYDLVRTICRQRLGDLPVIYVFGDICRSELLVEIEGMAFSRR